MALVRATKLQYHIISTGVTFGVIALKVLHLITFNSLHLILHSAVQIYEFHIFIISALKVFAKVCH